MKNIFLIFAIFSSFMFSQLKQLEVKPTENRGGIPIFRDYPDKMAVFFYSSFDNLKIVSSYGIDKIYDRGGGYFIVIISPERQRLEVQCPGYKTEIIHIKEGQARDCLFYSVEPKKEEDFSPAVKELAVTVQVNPQDAKISIDNKEIKNNTPTFFNLGEHILKVTKPGYAEYKKEIVISPANTFFQITLLTDDPVSVTIDSNPVEAEIYIDGLLRGKTKKGMFLYPGSYELRLNLSGYLALNEQIKVNKDEKSNFFNYNLVKNTGKLKIEINPANAIIRVNKETIVQTSEIELTPGTYQIDAEAYTYNSYKSTVVIERGKTTNERINLIQKTGKLQFSINPTEAVCVLNQNGTAKQSWSGLKIFSGLAVGSYELTAIAKGFETYSKNITITEDQTTIEDIQMSKLPELFEVSVQLAGLNPKGYYLFVMPNLRKLPNFEDYIDWFSVEDTTYGSITNFIYMNSIQQNLPVPVSLKLARGDYYIAIFKLAKPLTEVDGYVALNLGENWLSSKQEWCVKHIILDKAGKNNLLFNINEFEGYGCMWSCPWIYLNDGKDFVKFDEILKDHIGVRNDKFSELAIPKKFWNNEKISIMVSEELDEVSYIDNLYLLVNEKIVSPTGEQKIVASLEACDNKYLVMGKGEKHFLDFKIPEILKNEEIRSVKLVAKGYYVPQI